MFYDPAIGFLKRPPEGTRVILRSDSRFKMQSDVPETVTGKYAGSAGLWIQVKWDSGITNSYYWRNADYKHDIAPLNSGFSEFKDLVKWFKNNK